MLDDTHSPTASAVIDDACGVTGNEMVIAEGRSVREVATAAGFQQGYVYWLLKQAYKKHDLFGQVALVRLVLAANILPRR